MRNTGTDKNDSTTSVGPSTLLAALDALSLNDVPETDFDSDVEIVMGPIPIKKTRPQGKTRVEPKLTHPLFTTTTAAALSKSVKAAASSSLKPGSQSKAKSLAVGKQMSCTVTNSFGSREKFSPAVTAVVQDQLKPQKRKRGILPEGYSRLLYSYKDYTPKATVVYTRHGEETNDLVSSLKSGPLGFDLEWRVLFTRRTANGASVTQYDRRVAVVQIADTAGLILVVQVHPMSRFPKKLQELIENPDIPKLGVNILNDGNKLFKDYGIFAKNLVELGAVVHLADPEGGNLLAGTRQRYKNIIALAKLVEYYCGKVLDKCKAQRMGNWEAELDQLQVDYAANDAHCGLKIYEQLLQLAQQNGIVLSDERIKERCSSSVPSPYPLLRNAPPEALSVPDISMQAVSDSLDPIQSHSSAPSVASSQTGQSGVANMRPQYLRAYRFWYERGMDLDKMCVELSLKSKGYTTSGWRGTMRAQVNLIAANPKIGPTNLDLETNEKVEEDKVPECDALKPSTVISYVIGALQADSKLPFSMERLRELVQMDAGSWERHREWILQAWREGRGVGC
ncbi:hypothetical protein AX17_007036 [Amanita inopinata Kibby_2008]|nr:hypothetical protein AX17_007036 [Amanita inopinata Kibby_2008]